MSGVSKRMYLGHGASGRKARRRVRRALLGQVVRRQWKDLEACK